MNHLHHCFAALIRSVLKQRQAMDKITLQGDHTFNYTRERWTHGSIGCSTLRRIREKMSRQFRPFVFCLVPTESELAYSSMLEGLREILRLREAFVFDFDQMIIDHHVGFCKCNREFQTRRRRSASSKSYSVLGSHQSSSHWRKALGQS